MALGGGAGALLVLATCGIGDGLRLVVVPSAPVRVPVTGGLERAGVVLLRIGVVLLRLTVVTGGRVVGAVLSG